MTLPLDAHRTHLLDALTADLIGPYDPSSRAEILRKPPIRWYLTGFLIPEGEAHREDGVADASEEIDAGDEIAGEDSPEPAAKQPPILPSAIGMSVLLPVHDDGSVDTTVTVKLAWGEYVPHTTNAEVEALCEANNLPKSDFVRTGRAPRALWQRVEVQPAAVTLPLSMEHPGRLHKVPVPGAPQVSVEYRLEALSPEVADELRIGNPGYGAWALSVFIVNGRAITANREDDGRNYMLELNRQTLFQVAVQLHSSGGLLPRPDAHFGSSLDFDDKMVDLQFRHEVEWAVGHGIATKPIARDPTAPAHVHENPAVGARAVWLPHTKVARVRQGEIPGVEVSMAALAKLESAEDVRTALGALPAAYGEWIEQQAGIALDHEQHRTTQAELARRATIAHGRIEAGIELLATNAEIRRAFTWANEAMAEVARRRIGKGDPSFVPRWRLFQLAFLLLNLHGISDPQHPDRTDVELLFFPTGGGKTEAYLGVIATTLLLRRMRGQLRPDGGLGVAVLLRYTLRLLTLDQLERSSALICSLELLRRAHPQALGTERFAIGLWVGKSASANRLADVKRDIIAYKGNTAESKGSPFPLVKCPWCETPIEGRNMDTLPRNRKDPTRTVVVCGNRACEFSGARRGQEGTKVGELPVLFVDEQIYAELPAFVVATVDKFALLTHNGQAGKLFGRVHSYTEQQGHPRRFWGGGDGPSHVVPGASSEPLDDGLRPPDLIVQDELHLISGPLGTMVGLFETLVEQLCRYRPTDDPHAPAASPKIIAATATVRRASAQVRALYGRTRDEQTKLFPPQGVDAWQTFFAKRDTKANERMYVGVAAAGRSMKRSLLTTYLALLGASEHLYCNQAYNPASADPYKTIVGYFNSLRELGGMRRLVDDEIYRRVQKLDDRVPVDHRRRTKNHHRWLRSRTLRDPIELTSRIRTSELTDSKARLAAEFHRYEQAKANKTLDPKTPHPVDVALSSNMIAVGVDIDRMGTMVVAGQPKTTSEYIQASSRVGRDDDRPGFVVTVYNLHKPRDRSHYEHFLAYHESFYRYVEAQSVTPFSLPALDRALASVVVGMVRHSGAHKLATPRGAKEAALVQRATPNVAQVIRERAAAQPTGDMAAFVDGRVHNIAGNWRTIVMPGVDSVGSAADYCYSPHEAKRAGAKPLLRTPEDDAARGKDDRISPHDPSFAFVAPTSMRDVEPSIAVWVRRRPRKD